MTSKVYIVDDNNDLCQSLEYLFESVNIPTEIYHSPLDFLKYYQQTPGCLLVDVRMPEMSGLALQDVLQQKGIRIPVIFMTGHGDIGIAVRAMKKGAFDFFTKPFDHQVLLDTIHCAIEWDRNRCSQEKRYTAFTKLTLQERDIVERIVSNQSTIEIANALHLSPKTIEYHRSKIMRKLGAATLVQLVELYFSYRQHVKQ